jgi:hypothetical protein
MTEQLRFRISLHVSGLFYPFALHPGCPGSAWLSPVKVPVVGTLTRCEPQPASPPGSHTPVSAHCAFGHRAYRSRLFSGFLPWEGPWPTN